MFMAITFTVIVYGLFSLEVCFGLFVVLDCYSYFEEMPEKRQREEVERVVYKKDAEIQTENPPLLEP
uniref:SSD domain-containing protein n=1 Tax=Steinernema glaseri TaxID=37863 RepID=A0A1I8A423_9BILA